MELSAAEEYAIKIIAAESGMQHPVGEMPAAVPAAGGAILRLNWSLDLHWGLDANLTQRQRSIPRPR